MNTTLTEEQVPLVNALRSTIDSIPGSRKCLPSFISWLLLKNVLQNTSVKVGAHLYSCLKALHRRGFTSDAHRTVANMSSSGTSERRQYFGETYEIVNRKSPAALEAGPNRLSASVKNWKKTKPAAPRKW